MGEAKDEGARSAREKRLAEALRRNLSRRKAQARRRREGPAPAGGREGPSGEKPGEEES